MVDGEWGRILVFTFRYGFNVGFSGGSIVNGVGLAFVLVPFTSQRLNSYIMRSNSSS